MVRPVPDLLSLLRAHELFAPVPDDVFGEICSVLEIVNVPEGSELFREGDQGDSLFIVLEGCLRAVMSTQAGAECVLGEIHRGDVCGEMHVLYGGKRGATLIAAADSVLAQFPRNFLEFLEAGVPGTREKLHLVMRKRFRRNQAARILPTLFGSSDKAVYERLEPCMEWLCLSRGGELFRQGDPADGFYILCSGRLQVSAEDRSGMRKTVGEVTPGECVGEMALLSDEPRSATVTASRDSELMKVSREDFEQILSDFPTLALQMARGLGRRLRTSISGRSACSPVTMITLIPAGPAVPLTEVTAGLACALSLIAPTLHVSTSRLAGAAGASEQWVSSDGMLNSRIETWLDEQEALHRFVVYESDALDTPWTRCCLQRADRVLLVGMEDSKPSQGSVEQAWHAMNEGLSASRCTLVLLHPQSVRLPSGTSAWLGFRDVENVHHVRLSRESDYARLARLVSGAGVGLVLSGGGARGFAHIGVIRALEEQGVPIDLVGGASMGAYVAAHYALGRDWETMVRVTRKAFSRLKRSYDYTVPFISILKGRRFDRIIQGDFRKANIEDLWLNYFCVSSNLSTAEIVVHRRNALWKAVRASMSVPGILPPVLEGDCLLVDGGLLNNLPGDVARDLCGGIIIAVDVSEDMDFTVHSDRLPSAWEMVWRRLLPFRQAPRVPNLYEILDRSTMLSSLARRDRAMNDADLYLRPPVANFRRFQFEALDELVEQGYRYSVPRIAAWKNRRQERASTASCEASRAMTL